jgi:predicted RNase H-like nuclease
MNFIGIDLSWKVSPEIPFRTAAVVLNEKCVVIADALLTTNGDIVQFVNRYKDEGCIVGIDAPLIVPPKLKQRKCERMLLSCKIAVFPGNRKWFFRAFGGVRGEILVDELKRLNIPLSDFLKPKENTNALLEVYPYSAWKVLFGSEAVPKYKNRKRKEKIKGLNILRKKLLDSNLDPKLKLDEKIEHGFDVDISELSNKALDQLGDLLDALIAAYTLHIYWLFGEEKCVVLGDMKEGFILTLANDCLKKMANKRKY